MSRYQGASSGAAKPKTQFGIQAVGEFEVPPLDVLAKVRDSGPADNEADMFCRCGWRDSSAVCLRLANN